MGMKKKRGSEKVALTSPAPASSPKAQGSERKAAKNEIDAIFGNKKRKVEVEKKDVDEEQQSSGARPSPLSKRKSTKTVSTDDSGKKKKAGKESRSGKPSSAPPKSRRKTEDGLTIYGEDELKWNSKSAGGTSLCPFDCDCCF